MGYIDTTDKRRRIQAALIAHGYDCGPAGADGVLGPATSAAIRKFRADHGLVNPPDQAVVDTPLLRALGLLAIQSPAVQTAGGLLAAILLPNLKGLFAMSFLAGYKTYIVAALMLLTGLAGVVGIDIPNFTGQAPGNLVMEALAFFFLRQGVKTGA